MSILESRVTNFIGRAGPSSKWLLVRAMRSIDSCFGLSDRELITFLDDLVRDGKLVEVDWLLEIPKKD